MEQSGINYELIIELKVRKNMKDIMGTYRAYKNSTVIPARVCLYHIIGGKLRYARRFYLAMRGIDGARCFFSRKGQGRHLLCF